MATDGKKTGIAPSIVQVNEPITKQKFSVLASRFEGFEKEIADQRNKKRDDEEKKIIQLKEDLEGLRGDLKEEEKRRIETTKALKNWFEDRFSEWRTEVETPIHAKLDECLSKIAALTNRMEVLEQKVEQDRRNMPLLIERHVSELAGQLEEFKARYKAREMERDRKEDEMKKYMANQESKMHVLFEAERKEREQKLSVLRNEIDAERNMRSSSVDLLKATTTDELDDLRHHLDQEVRTRETVSEEIVQSINHYAAALQDAIKRIV
eukprot:TRINITY_DN4768_c0_g1_i1.p1 TRINITY_DN4768_c0_g1~~TRINITY_DN4768_c0_g1_i1.p1  ORF type:complete len:283 (+),score=68.07 TRINITY_DN4768_c0_g1_i1:52-849(+)